MQLLEGDKHKKSTSLLAKSYDDYDVEIYTKFSRELAKEKEKEKEKASTRN